MWDFVVGVVVGVIGTKIIFKNKKTYKDVSAQADELVILPSEPIKIPAPRKYWLRGTLSNFWGPSLPDLSEDDDSATSSWMK